MKYRELLDKVVFVLHELKSKRGMLYYDLNQIVKMTGYHSDLSETNKIAKYLEAQGYIKILSEFGTIFAKITPSGLVYVEDRNLIPNIGNFNYDAVPVYNENSYLENRKPILDIVKKMKNILTKNKKGKTDASNDVDILKLEMSKINPNYKIIDLKLHDLEQEILLRHYSEQIREALDI